MRNARWMSGKDLATVTALAAGLVFFGCGGSSNTAKKDGAVDHWAVGGGDDGSRGDTGDVREAADGAVSLDGGIVDGAVPDGAVADRVVAEVAVVEAGVRDLGADLQTPVGVDSAPDLPALDVPADWIPGGADSAPDLAAPDIFSGGTSDSSPDEFTGGTGGSDSAADQATPIDAPGSCAAGYHNGGNGTCVPNGTCSAGYHDNGTGVCVSSGCAAGYHDDGIGMCVVSGCAPGYHDGGTGTCMPSNTCATGYHLDESGVCILTCAAGTHDGGNGTCVPSGTCAAGYHNDGTGACIRLGCAAGYHVGANGTCVADPFIPPPSGGSGGGAGGAGGSGGIGDAGTVDAPLVDAGPATDAGEDGVGDDGGGCTDGGTCACAVLEGFESGVWPAPGWSGSTVGTVSAASAHDGTYGIRDPAASAYLAPWSYRTDVSVGTVGDRITAWARPGPGTGRAYIGFAASASGCKSFVAATNSPDIRFQDNPDWDFVELNTSEQSFTVGRWYKMEIEFTASDTVVGRLYDQDGTTLLNSVTQVYTSSLVGGIALRSFGDGFDMDTVSICRP